MLIDEGVELPTAGQTDELLVGAEVSRVVPRFVAGRRVIDTPADLTMHLPATKGP